MPLIENFLHSFIDQHVKQPLDRQFGMQNFIRDRNNKYFWNSIFTGRPEGRTPEEQAILAQLNRLPLPMPGPSKFVQAGQKFIPAVESGIEFMGNPVIQKNFLQSIPLNTQDYIQGARGLAQRGRGILTNLLNRQTAEELMQSRIKAGLPGAGQYSKLIPKK